MIQYAVYFLAFAGYIIPVEVCKKWTVPKPTPDMNIIITLFLICTDVIHRRFQGCIIRLRVQLILRMAIVYSSTYTIIHFYHVTMMPVGY